MLLVPTGSATVADGLDDGMLSPPHPSSALTAEEMARKADVKRARIAVDERDPETARKPDAETGSGSNPLIMESTSAIPIQIRS